MSGPARTQGLKQTIEILRGMFQEMPERCDDRALLTHFARWNVQLYRFDQNVDSQREEAKHSHTERPPLTNGHGRIAEL